MKLINTEIGNKHCKPLEQMMYSFSDTTRTFSEVPYLITSTSQNTQLLTKFIIKAYSRVHKKRGIASNALLATKNPIIFTVNSTNSDHTFQFSSQSTPCWC